MNEDRRRILNMLAEGTVTADEADRLLAAMAAGSGGSSAGDNGGSSGNGPSYFRVVIDAEDDKDGPVKVNVRIPIKLIRAGVRLSSLIPQPARGHVDAAMHEHGVDVDLSQITPENLDEIVEQLSELTVDVDSASARVRVFCE
jgi:hypothetical protein